MRGMKGTMTLGVVLLVVSAAVGVSAAAANATHVRGALTVKAGTQSCSRGVCTLKNSGTGSLAPYGSVTFTTTITADGINPPCGPMSEWVRAVRSITTKSGTLVLNEAGLQCPVGKQPHVLMVWAVDSAASSGVFAGARGAGSDEAWPARGTASQRGVVTLKH